jgi:hypothetical protein
VTEPDFLRVTRASYDAVAADYAGHFRDELAACGVPEVCLACELQRCAIGLW